MNARIMDTIHELCIGVFLLVVRSQNLGVRVTGAQSLLIERQLFFLIGMQCAFDCGTQVEILGGEFGKLRPMERDIEERGARRCVACLDRSRKAGARGLLILGRAAPITKIVGELAQAPPSRRARHGNTQ